MIESLSQNKIGRGIGYVPDPSYMCVCLIRYLGFKAGFSPHLPARLFVLVPWGWEKNRGKTFFLHQERLARRGRKAIWSPSSLRIGENEKECLLLMAPWKCLNLWLWGMRALPIISRFYWFRDLKLLVSDCRHEMGTVITLLDAPFRASMGLGRCRRGDVTGKTCKMSYVLPYPISYFSPGINFNNPFPLFPELLYYPLLLHGTLFAYKHVQVIHIIKKQTKPVKWLLNFSSLSLLVTVLF